MVKGESSVSIWADKEGRLHVGIMVGGKRIHRRLPEGATKSDAKLIEAEMRKSAAQRRPSIPDNPQMVEIMCLYMAHAETLRSADTAKFHALRAGPWLEGVRASDIDIAVAKMISDMRGHYKPATINRSIGAIKTALRMAFRNRLTTEDYGTRITRLAENNARHSYLTIAQVKKLADCASDQVRIAIWIALLTGCRRGEILKLTPDDIQGDKLRIQAGNTKTLRQRTIPIVPAARPWLDQLPIKINFEGLKTGFGRARKKAGIDANFHDLRHSCASLLINLGVPLEVVRDILGHTSVKTTERYAHLHIDKQEDALMRLSREITG
jgi:integrase